jgi:hypothetical protein
VDAAPCGTETVEGRFTSAGAALRLIVAPPFPAADVRATVQFDEVGGVIDTGLQEKPFSAVACIMATVPPLADADIADAKGVAATGLEI